MRPARQHTIVIPFDKQIIEKYAGYKTILYLTAATPLFKERDYLSRFHGIQSVILDYSDTDMAMVAFNEEWLPIPVTIFVKGMGSFKFFNDQLDLIRKINPRIIVFGNSENDYADIMKLTSLGICAGSYINESSNWNELTELLHYSQNRRVERAPTEPFFTQIRTYNSDSYNDFETAYFNNADVFLWLDANERIFLSYGDMINSKEVGQGIETLNNIRNNNAYRKHFEERDAFFSELNDCSACPAWSVCYGKFFNLENKNERCSRLFEEMMKYIKN
jgi:hypothetical protein